MQITRRADAQPYFPPLHVGVDAFRLQGCPSFCTVGLSHYEAGGMAEMSASPQAKIYVVLQGELTVALASGEHAVLGPMDSCLIEANETREVRNQGGDQATLLVISPV